MKTVYFEDLPEGATFWSNEIVVNKDEMLQYARQNDPWPFHVDEDAAKKTAFGALVASGGYTISLTYRLFHTICNTPETIWAFQGGFDWHISFLRPLRPGDRVRYRVVIGSKRFSSKPGRGIVNSVCSLINQDGEEAFRLEVAWLIAVRPPALS